jgi:endonuclease YncB( thermonuclease family)
MSATDLPNTAWPLPGNFMAWIAKVPYSCPIFAFSFNLMKTGVRIVCALLGLLIAAAKGLCADDIHSRQACRFELLGTGKVIRVVDGRSVMLEDGREVLISGIWTPAPAQAALEALLRGQLVELRGLQDVTDRYGRTVAFLLRQDGAIDVAGYLLARGQARVAAQIGDAACAAELLSRELVARTSKLGLWSEPYYDVIEAGNAPQLLAARGHFSLVEGKILSVRESGGTIYLNFGRRWSEALTVTISKRHERIFSGAGLSPKRLENRTVRIRGWIEERNGPRIEASRPEQIEVAGLN